MNKKINLLMFVMGAIAGSVATWQYVKKKYERIAQEEIDSVKERFKTHKELISEEQEQEKKDLVDCINKIKECGYGETHAEEIENKEEKATMDKPYVISPDDFMEFDDYETISLTYYSDKILADDNDELVDDVEEIVGFESLKHFGEYEDDAVFVRNDRLKCDYEILLDHRKYSEVVQGKHHRTED